MTTERPALHAVRVASRLGERLRQLRVSAGLTQTDLAGERFSKEYISQIERGKTRPTAETIEWLAARLGVDATFLASGVSTDERARAEAILARAEALTEKRDFAGAIDEYTSALGAVVASGAVELQVRVLSGEAWARAHSGDVRSRIDLLGAGARSRRGRRSSPTSTAREILFRLGVCRYLLSSIATAVALFGEALALLERSPLPSDLLRSNIFTWRSRCYRRQRDYEAAREDVERALELAEALQDTRALGEAYFQASLIAERDGHWVLARTYAERAKAAVRGATDRSNVGRLLNNLGGLEFLLGKPDEAIERLKEAFAVALEHGDDDDVATVVSSLAQVHLRTGEPVTAEEHARHALRRLGRARGSGRRDRQRAARARARAARAGAARRGRDGARRGGGRIRPALVRLAPGRRMDRAGRPGPAPRRRPQAAALYRRAAEALQDFRF